MLACLDVIQRCGQAGPVGLVPGKSGGQPCADRLGGAVRSRWPGLAAGLLLRLDQAAVRDPLRAASLERPAAGARTVLAGQRGGSRPSGRSRHAGCRCRESAAARPPGPARRRRTSSDRLLDVRAARLGILEALDADELVVVGRSRANWKNRSLFGVDVLGVGVGQRRAHSSIFSGRIWILMLIRSWGPLLLVAVVIIVVRSRPPSTAARAAASRLPHDPGVVREQPGLASGWRSRA